VKARLFFIVALIGATVLSIGHAIEFAPINTAVAQTASDASLAAVRREDRFARNAKGVMTRLSTVEHLRRASVYHANRAFEEAREQVRAVERTGCGLGVILDA